ncbi:MAG: valine--tRNA ligase, partial [Gammaproteobacteria bacterium]
AQDAIEELEWVKGFIVGVRQIRSGMDIKPGKPLAILLQDGSSTDQQRLHANQHYIENLARIESITWLDAGEEAPESATALVGDMKILIPMAGLIDKDVELARLSKEIGKLEADIERTRGKLANDSFVSKAPEAVVQKEKDRLAELEVAVGNLTGQRNKIAAL